MSWVRMPAKPVVHARYAPISRTPETQRPQATNSGGISLTSSFTETLRKVKSRPATIAMVKPRTTRDGIRRESASGASRAGVDTGVDMKG